MWKLWKNKAFCLAALCAVLLTACGGSAGYDFDGAAVSGSYSQPAWSAASAPEVQEFELTANAMVEADPVTGRANVLLGNPESNVRDCRVRLVLDQTGQTIFESELLRPGERVAYATLELEPFEELGSTGPYAATAEFEVLDQTTGELICTVEAAVSIEWN